MEQPDFLSSYLKFVKGDTGTEAPEIYQKWVGLSIIAACLQRKTWLSWETDIYPNLYVVLIGSSGCRKGTAMHPGRKLLAEMGVVTSVESTTREALIEVMSNILLSYNDPRFPDDPLCTHNSLTIFSPELSVFLGKDNSEFIFALTDWFDCLDPWSYMTKGRGLEEIHKVFVNMIGATTPELIQINLPQDAIGGGLTSRIIFIYSRPPRKPVAFPTDPFDNKNNVDKIKEQLGRILILEGPFTASSEFKEIYGPWYEKSFNKNIFEHTRQLEPYLTRRSLHLRKISMIASASRSDDMVLRGVDFNRALSFLEEAERYMASTFAGYGRLDYSQFIPQVMAMIIEEKELYFSKIMARFSSDLNRGEIEDIVASLVEQDFCRIQTIAYKDAQGNERQQAKVWHTGEAVR